MACNCSKTAVAELMRVAWRSVGAILERVAARGSARSVDLLDGLRRIGIDEISHRTGQRYLTVVVDHHTGRLVWAAPGRDRKTVLAFFDALGEERCKQIELVSCDMASWIAGPVAERCPDAVRCVDPFHVIELATDALDEVRREVWNEARTDRATWSSPRETQGRAVRGLEEPREPHRPPAARSSPRSRRPTGRCTARTCSRSNSVRSTECPPRKAEKLLDGWLDWARRCRLPSFVKLARTITEQRAGILAAVKHGLSNARVEQINTQIRLDHPPRVRVPHRRGADRARDAQTRRALPAATAR